MLGRFSSSCTESCTKEAAPNYNSSTASLLQNLSESYACSGDEIARQWNSSMSETLQFVIVELSWLDKGASVVSNAAALDQVQKLLLYQSHKSWYVNKRMTYRLLVLLDNYDWFWVPFSILWICSWFISQVKQSCANASITGGRWVRLPGWSRISIKVHWIGNGTLCCICLCGEVCVLIARNSPQEVACGSSSHFSDNAIIVLLVRDGNELCRYDWIAAIVK